MLKQRLLTALVLGGLIVWGILALPTAYLALVFALFALIGAWEWGRMSGFQHLGARMIYVVCVAVLLTACWFALQSMVFSRAIIYAAVLWWLVAWVWLLNYPLGEHNTAFTYVLKGAAGALVLVPTWSALVILHRGALHGPVWVLFVVALAWVADSGAYVAGRRWGRHKLASRVSPGKTWEGVYGALLSVLVYATLMGFLLGIRDGRLFAFIALSLCLVPVSVVGDLFESMLKRHQGLKDSGQLLPGHGGMLDRIDSLTAAAPAFVLGLLWLNIPT
jgi:phosphatidate cytidylyltransferase